MKIKVVSKKIILQDKDYTEMEAWEKIFFMFLNTKKSYASKTDIAEATKEYWNKRIATDKIYTDEGKEIQDDTSQGTVSKNRETLEGIIVYKLCHIFCGKVIILKYNISCIRFCTYRRKR